MVPRRDRPLLAALFLAALALRPQLVGVGPLLPRIERDLHVSHAVAGLFSTLYVLALGLFAFAGGAAARRLGTAGAVAWALAAVAAAGAARAAAPGVAAALALTVALGAAAAVAGALLPVAVKERFARRPALATATYTAGMNVGATIGAASSVPLARALGGWRPSLLVLAAAAALSAGAWTALRRDTPRAASPGVPEGAARALRRRLVWALVLVFGLQAFCFWGLSAWLAETYHDRGWSEARAGALVAVLNVASLGGTLVVLLVGDRLPSRRRGLVATTLVLLAGLLGLALHPAAGWLWAVLAGWACGALLPLALTLPLDAAATPRAVAAVTGAVLGVGYGFAALAPFAFGALRDATGSFRAASWLLVGAAAALLAVVAALSRERLAPRPRDAG